MYKLGAKMIQGKGSNELDWMSASEGGERLAKVSSYESDNAVENMDRQVDINAFIKSKLSRIKLLSKDQEREAVEKMEYCIGQIALLICTANESASEFVSLASCAMARGLKKHMLLSEDRYFVLRREMDHLAQAPGNMVILNQLASQTLMRQSEGKIPLSLVRLIASVDWPRSLLFALAKRYGSRRIDGAVLDKAIDEYILNFHSPPAAEAPLEDAHRYQLDYFAKAYLRARDRLVTHNLRLVYYIAKRYAQKSEHLPDLIQEGTFGLVRAVEKYRLASGFRFSTYAYYWVDSKVRKHRVNLDKVMPIPQEMNNDLLRISQCLEQLKIRGSKPTTREISKEINISEDKLDAILQLRQFGISLDEKNCDDESFSMHAKLADANSNFAEVVIKERCADYISHIMEATLTEREVYIVNQRFGRIGSDPRTLQELSDILGISRERVRQLEIKALNKLKKHLDRDALN